MTSQANVPKMQQCPISRAEYEPGRAGDWVVCPRCGFRWQTTVDDFTRRGLAASHQVPTHRPEIYDGGIADELAELRDRVANLEADLDESTLEPSWTPEPKTS